jgi:hypothetical protein
MCLRSLQHAIWYVFSTFSFNLLNSFQPFRFIERPAVRGLITYLNPKLQDTDIPKKSCIAAAVDGKVQQLEKITIEIIEVCVFSGLLTTRTDQTNSESNRKCPPYGMVGPLENVDPSHHSVSASSIHRPMTIPAGSSRSISSSSTRPLDDTLEN